MNTSSTIIHHVTIALTVAINAVSVGIGEGIAGSAALKALNTQPGARSEITKIAILGMALIETAAIMGVSIAMILLLTPGKTPDIYFSLSEIGIAAAICVPGFFVGLVSARPTQAACMAAARQPFFAEKIMRFMLISQSLIQTPIVFGFIVAMFIKSQAVSIDTLAEALRLIASGVCIGFGSIGPALGMSSFARTACEAIGTNRNCYNQLLTFTFISEAIIETPIIFSLVVAMLLLSSTTTTSTHPLLSGIAMLAAAFSIGIGTIGPGIGSGGIAASACKQIAAHPEHYGLMSRLSMFGQGLIDTCAIYALLIAIMLILWV
jgi:F0F1-type ATP synthase membrane subunit c/vacuolar-type H+-ATPase subunit K